MSKNFVPFTTALTKTVAGKTGAPGAAAASELPKAFRSVSANGAAASSDGAEPKVTLERKGDRVSRIRIECCCGHVIELDCDY
jgi:hypothetical protein